MKPLEDFCCLNEACPDFGQRGAGNLRVHQTYGKYQSIRLLRRAETLGKSYAMWKGLMRELELLVEN